MQKLQIPTENGSILDSVLFSQKPSETVVIAITGIHGNFYSNPFYVNFGETFNRVGIDFIYAQTRNAFGKIPIINHLTGQPEHIGSFNEDFNDAVGDVRAYVDFAEKQGYKNIILVGHSLGANKVIRYLSENNDERVAKFILLSPANIQHLTSSVTREQRAFVKAQIQNGKGDEMLPFELFGWLPAQANTAYQWLFSDILDNVHLESDKDFSQIAKIRHTGALLIGTFDRFTYGDPKAFLQNINDHFPNANANTLIFIENTGHTYQQKEQAVADKLADLVQGWLKN